MKILNIPTVDCFWIQNKIRKSLYELFSECLMLKKNV